ncbi:MAG: S1C family serine protease [Gemmataceae bacterium]
MHNPEVAIKRWLGAIAFALTIPVVAQAADIDDVLKNQAQRIKVINSVKPSVVAIFPRGGKGGGSGVLISPDGYALTNWHVVSSSNGTMKCGLPDGVLYDAVLVGWDKIGDVALIKLLHPNGNLILPNGNLYVQDAKTKKFKETPQDPKEKFLFPYAKLGDSDAVREGDWSLAMGNPFLLATDFTPTVTFGMISGVHRYQPPSGIFLEYTDCIQIDTSINPGNSGGPLFDMKGELIGINGRGSFDKRRRINSGVGYAISINQIKNFMGHLKAGMDADHATLGAAFRTATSGDGTARIMVDSILPDSDAADKGLDLDDELVSFNGRVITSTNQYNNVLKIVPRGWKVPVGFRHNGLRKQELIRLAGAQRRVIGGQPKPKPKPRPKRGTPSRPSPAKKYLITKGDPSYVLNKFFNKFQQDQVLKDFKKHGSFAKFQGPWTIDAQISLGRLKSKDKFRLEITEDRKKEPYVTLKVGAFPYSLKPEASLPALDYRKPDGSGGFLAAMYLYRRFLTKGLEGFKGSPLHMGYEPIYPPTPDAKAPTDWKKRQVLAETVKMRHGQFRVKWYFGLGGEEKGKLLAMEMYPDPAQDIEDVPPAEVYFSDYRPGPGGGLLPYRIQVRYRGGFYGTVNVTQFDLKTAG